MNMFKSLVINAITGEITAPSLYFVSQFAKFWVTCKELVGRIIIIL